MIVSWDWLKQYVRLDVSVDDLAARLTKAGLNHESTEEVAGDLAIELEVTSNRPDCLGHIGVAREVAAVLEREVAVPDVKFATSDPPAAQLTSVGNECPELCARYVARVIRGVRFGPSPDWLRRRLASCRINSINNVVDATNYVLLEIGQPLHAFDYDKLIEHRIVVRRGLAGESIVAINQKRYELSSDMCVIADAKRPVAVAGVMGGLETEVSDRTTNLLIESAEFDPLAIRRTSRALGLSSESSYRFMRGVDPEGVEWASRRCCQLIAELAGGELAEGAVVVGEPTRPRQPIVLRFSQIKRILGIDVDPDEVRGILARLGLSELRGDTTVVEVRPPSWRKDLEREIDLIEEVGRIHGYEHVPEDSQVPMASSARSPRERIDAAVRDTLCAAGFHETVTISFVDARLAEYCRFWTDAPPLGVDHPSRRQENLLRQSLIPSLLSARQLNESRGTRDSELFELARVYLPSTGDGLPEERMLLGLLSARGLRELKGVTEALLARLHARVPLEVRVTNRKEFAPGCGAQLRIDGELAGFLGRLAEPVAAQFELREACCVAELDLEPLYRAAQLWPRYEPVPNLPASQRDLSLVVDESVTWSQVESLVRSAARPYLEAITFFDVYRGRQVPAGKKSLHFGVRYRASDRTLTREQVDEAQQAVIAACRNQLGAELRGSC